MKTDTTPGQRQVLITKIHVAKNQLNMADESYRALLQRVAGQPSCGKIRSTKKLEAVLAEMRRLGWVPKRTQKSAGRPNPTMSKRALISKIEAQLAEADRSWLYAHALAQRMYGIERVDWLDVDQLHRVVAAMAIDAKRHGRRV